MRKKVVKRLKKVATAIAKIEGTSVKQELKKLKTIKKSDKTL